MSEEEMRKEENLEHEVIDRLKSLDTTDFDYNKVHVSYVDAMLKARDIILDLYNEEKEKNEKEQRRIYRFGYNNACNDIGKLNDKNFISKDEIKEKLENIPHWLTDEEVGVIKFFVNELLEGEINK